MRLKFLLGSALLVLLVFLAASQLPGLLQNSGESGPSASPPDPSGLEVYYLDVGQGDAEILKFGGLAMLIDAGTNAAADTLLKDIRALGISRFDTVIATHPHEDHIGGLDAVIKNFGIGAIYLPDVTTNTGTFSDVLAAIKNKGLSVTRPIPGSTFRFGQIDCNVLAPNSTTYADLNDYSIVLRTALGKTSFLFTGDAQNESEAEMLAQGYNLKADVLKVGHHGSSSSSSAPFLRAVSPQYAIISCGANNDYGDPHQVTLSRLNSAGARILRTDLAGTITVTSDGNSLAVKTEK